jgi:hypothetical protein
MIKEDEILVVKTILEHCKKEYDHIPTDKLYSLGINYKRLEYILEKLTWFIESGISVRTGWLRIPVWEIKEYYKNVHKIML